MSSKGSSIGIGGLIFWAFIAYSIFGGGDDEKEVEITVDDKPSIVEQVKENVDTIITEEDRKLIKEEINNLKEKVLAKSEESEEPEKIEEESDSIYGNPDIYGDDSSNKF